MDLEKLRDKTIVDIIRAFPSMEWYCRQGAARTPIPLGKVTLAQYDTVKPVKEPDYLFRLSPALVPEQALKQPQGRSVGLTSLVTHQGQTYHLPMIDLDAHGRFDFFDDAQLMEMYKKTIKQETEMEKGVFLRSGPKRNFHFIGIGRLLTPDQYLTFLGLALTMKCVHGDEWINLADSRHIGHCISRFAHRAELGKTPSRYDHTSLFGTLRITPKPGYAGPPVAIDFLA